MLSRRFTVHELSLVSPVGWSNGLQSNATPIRFPLRHTTWQDICCPSAGNLVRPGSDLVVEALGPTQLRGRAAAVEVFAVERRRMTDA